MTTDNHELKTPEQGSLNWHDPLNENFQAIDAAIELRDPEANRDQHSPKQGAKFLATDTGVRYIGDGDSWVEAPTQSPQQVAAPSYTSDPSDADIGTLWYRSDLDELRTQAGESIKTLAKGGASSSTGNAIVQNSLDSKSDYYDFFNGKEGANDRAKVYTEKEVTAEGNGAVRIDQPADNTKLGNVNNFYGTGGHHYMDERPEYPSNGLGKCHIRFWAQLDPNYDIDNPWAGTQAGKGFPGFEAEWNGNVSYTEDAWEALGAIWSADEIGGSKDDWILSYYVYDQLTPEGDNGRTFHPDTPMKKGQWYQIDRFVDVENNVIKQWQDGNLEIELGDGDIQIAGASSPYDKVQAVRNTFYYGGGWGAPDGSGHNYAYLDRIQTFDSEQQS